MPPRSGQARARERRSQRAGVLPRRFLHQPFGDRCFEVADHVLDHAATCGTAAQPLDAVDHELGSRLGGTTGPVEAPNDSSDSENFGPGLKSFQ